MVHTVRSIYCNCESSMIYCHTDITFLYLYTSLGKELTLFQAVFMPFQNHFHAHNQCLVSDENGSHGIAMHCGLLAKSANAHTPAGSVEFVFHLPVNSQEYQRSPGAWLKINVMFNKAHSQRWVRLDEDMGTVVSFDFGLTAEVRCDEWGCITPGYRHKLIIDGVLPTSALGSMSPTMFSELPSPAKLKSPPEPPENAKLVSSNVTLNVLSRFYCFVTCYC